MKAAFACQRANRNPFLGLHNYTSRVPHSQGLDSLKSTICGVTRLSQPDAFYSHLLLRAHSKHPVIKSSAERESGLLTKAIFRQESTLSTERMYISRRLKSHHESSGNRSQRRFCMAIQGNTAKPATPPRAGLPASLGQFKAEIEKRAKEIFLKRQNSKVAGDALSDWLKGEREIKANHLLT
jgi:hypothetical protein